MMNNVEARTVCPKCNGMGWTFTFKKEEGKREPEQTFRVKNPCPHCWGRGYLDSAYVDVPQMEQNTKYFMYP